VDLKFAPRSKLADREWDEEAKKWERPELDREILKELNRPSTLNGMVRLIVHVLLIAAAGWLTVFVSPFHILFSLIPYLVYAFLVGFLNGIEHELRHKIVFSKRMNWFSETVYFLIHLLIKDGSRYERVSHRIHHRFTMVFGVDPESDFPEVITIRWVRRLLLGILINVLTLGIPSFFKGIWTLLERIFGKIHPMVLAQCSAAEKKSIQRESLVILLINLAALGVLIVWQQWFLIVLLMLGPRAGLAIVSFYFFTEHIGMMYNSNDQRMCTRGVKVSRFVRFFYGGLDEHVEHHLFPAVPSRNLTKLRNAISWKIPERKNVIQCWKEILAIARHKHMNPGDEIQPQM
jgi:fatty acid desaturase